MSSARLLIAVGLLVQLAAVADSYAYKLEPISRVFPSGSKATQSFEVINNGKERIALTVSIMTLERDEKHVETNRPAEEQFLVYPPQLVLSPGKRQTIRVTWLGETKLARESAYRIIVAQVPIHLLDKTAKPVDMHGEMKVLLTYRGTLLIRPPGARPKIETNVRVEAGKRLVLSVMNTGTAVATVKRCSINAILPNGKVATVHAPELAQIVNHRILAANRRVYDIKWPTGLPAAPLKAVGQCVAGS